MPRYDVMMLRSVFAPMLGLALIACGPPKPGTPTTFDDFCDAKYDSPNPGGSSDELVAVSIEGYLIPPTLFSMCSDTCSFDLAEHPDGSGRTVHYSVRLGDGANQLAPLPERFASSDFKLRTQDDQVLGFGDKVRLHGRRLGTAAANDCQLYGTYLIEKP